MTSLLGVGRKPRMGSGGGDRRGNVVWTRPWPMGAGVSQPVRASSIARLRPTAATSSAPLRQRLPRNSTTPATPSSAANRQAHIAAGSAAAPTTRPAIKKAASQ